MPRELVVEEPPSANPGLSLASLARTIWKQKICIILVWILLSVIWYRTVKALPGVYLSESLILVDSQKIPEKFVSATVASDLEARIGSIREQILSSGELKNIINSFNLYQAERKTMFEEEILDLMRRDISIELVTVGNRRDPHPAAFRIGYQGSNPEIVAKVANKLTDLYVEQNLKTRESQAAGTSEFLDAQLKDAKKRLDDLEAAVSAYKVQHNGELPEQENSLNNALTGLHTRLQANMDAINRAQQTKIIQESTLSALEANEAAQVRALADQAAGKAASQSGVPAPKKPSELLQERLYLLLTQYTENFPEVKNTRAALEIAKRTEAEEEKKKLAQAASVATSAVAAVAQTVPPPELARIREQISSLKAQIKGADTELANRAAEQKQIIAEIDSYRNRIEHLPVREQEMARITRDYEMSKENYKSLLDKQMAAAMALDMERRQQSERFTILDRARVPEKPIKPQRRKLFTIGSSVSLAIGLLLGVMLELRRNVFLGEWELPEGTVVLARLPYFEVAGSSASTSREPRSKGGHKKVAAAVSTLVCLVVRIPGIFDRL